MTTVLSLVNVETTLPDKICMFGSKYDTTELIQIDDYFVPLNALFDAIHRRFKRHYTSSYVPSSRGNMDYIEEFKRALNPKRVLDVSQIESIYDVYQMFIIHPCIRLFETRASGKYRTLLDEYKNKMIQTLNKNADIDCVSFIRECAVLINENQDDVIRRNQDGVYYIDESYKTALTDEYIHKALNNKYRQFISKFQYKITQGFIHRHVEYCFDNIENVVHITAGQVDDGHQVEEHVEASSSVSDEDA